MKNRTGSTLTKEARQHTLDHLRDGLNKAAMSCRLQNITARHIERYIADQKQAGVGLRTLQNRMAHIRGELRAMGRDKLADSERLSSKALAIDGANRDGTHRALGQDEYAQKLDQMRELHRGAAACMALQRELGLRAREAVQSVDSLKQWQKALEAGERVHVLHGTKGGRARDTLPANRERALEAVKEAIEASKEQGGRLIPSATLQGAMRAYGRVCEAVELKGELASHSLRYSYTQEVYLQHLERMHDKAEALAATSMELGHGDGRGTYVAQVYLKG